MEKFNDQIVCSCGNVQIDFPIFRRVYSLCKCKKCFQINQTSLKSTTLVFDPIIVHKKPLKRVGVSNYVEQVSCSSCGDHLFISDKTVKFYFLAVDLITNKTQYVLDEFYEGKDEQCQVELEIADALS